MFPPPAGCSERTKCHRTGRRHYSFKRGGAITVYRAMERKGPGPGVSFAKGCAHAHRSDSNRREPVHLYLDLSSHHDGRLVPQHCAKGVSAYLRILCKCIPITLEPVQPYGKYIKWLMEQDKEQAVSYWDHYLSGHEQQTVLPKQKKTKGKSRQEHVTFSFSKEESSRLSELAAREEVTLSTIFHTIWGILLQKYNNNDDAVFGSVISGRPAEIEGIEHMVGLFINTMPVRVQGAKTPFLQLIKDMQKDRLAAEAYSYHLYMRFNPAQLLNKG